MTDESTQNGSSKPAVAPAPPPPPAVAEQLSLGGQGFDPKGSHVFIEFAVIGALVIAAGAAFMWLGGAIAAWATPLVPLSVDETLGAASAEQVELSAPDCGDAAAQKYIEALAAPLLSKVKDQPFTFHFRVADTDEVNAFALPGGYVTVNRGLIEAAESGEEVAGVIGHEIQHALLRHGTKRILRQMGGRALIALVLGGTDLHMIGDATGSLMSLSYDREQESEADVRGIELLVASEMNPEGLATFFARLSKDSVRPPELLSTHPDPGNRAEVIKEVSAGAKFTKLPPLPKVQCKK